MEQQKNDAKKGKPAVGVIILTAALVVVFAIMIVYFSAGKKPVPSESAVTAKPVQIETTEPIAPFEPVAMPESVPVQALPVAASMSASTPEPAAVPEPAPAVIAAEPQGAKGFFQAGENNYYKGNFDAAIADFKKAAELDPKYADAYCEMGVSYMEKLDWETAIAQLAKAIEIDPNHPKAQYAIAVSYARKPQPDVKLAREHFEISKKLGFVYPQWFEDFLKRLESGQRFPGQAQ